MRENNILRTHTYRKHEIQPLITTQKILQKHKTFRKICSRGINSAELMCLDIDPRTCCFELLDRSQFTHLNTKLGCQPRSALLFSLAAPICLHEFLYCIYGNLRFFKLCI